KRSGDGFVAHKDTLVSALSRSMAERVTLFDDEAQVGRKGLLQYLKALAGSNVIKIVPANGASDSQAKAVKVVCGSHTGFISANSWIRDKTPFTFCQIRVSPCNAIMPNVGSAELAEALSKVVPFAATGEERAILQCVKVCHEDGKLTLVASDGFTVSEVKLPLDGEGEALVDASDVKNLIPALRKANRVKLYIEEKPNGDNGDLLSKSVTIDTELVKYRLDTKDGTFPDYSKVIPKEAAFTAFASFDTKEAIKAIKSVLTLWYDDKLKPLYRPIIIGIEEGKVSFQAKEGRGKTDIVAETQGNLKVAVSGIYLIKTLKACGDIVNMRLVSATSPMIFANDSENFTGVVMPITMPTETAPEAEAQAEAEAVAEVEAKATLKVAKANLKQAIAKGEAQAITEAKQAVKV
ncbi:unnamed protein product, partial [marine sediment metagenome]